MEWLFTHVEGFADRRDARKYACNLLKAGFIRHTVNKITFSEQCYYVFGDLSGGKSVRVDVIMWPHCHSTQSCDVYIMQKTYMRSLKKSFV